MFRNTHHLLTILWKSRQGVAMLEFALLLPILLFLLAGIIEVSSFVLFHQKVDNATARTADLITQINAEEVQCATLSGRYDELNESMRPYAGGSMIVSNIEAEYPGTTEDDSAPLDQTVIWQWKSPDAGQSDIGNAGGNANGPGWPNVFRVAPDDGGMFNGDRVIAVEVFYTYSSIFKLDQILNLSVGDGQITTKRAFYRARLGSMERLSC